MNILIGLLIIAAGAFGQSSSYVPIKKVKNWAWENFWLTQGVFAWLIFPLIGALIAIPAGQSLVGVYDVPTKDILKCIGYGMLWGVGGLTFGLGMRYLGVALGQTIALGICSAFGTTVSSLLDGENLFDSKGLVLLAGVGMAIAGIATIGYAGALKAKNISAEERKKAVKDFALKKGLIIAVFAGIMSACFKLGLNSGEAIKTQLTAAGASVLLALNPVILLVTFGGFIVNGFYCLFCNLRNKTFGDYVSLSSKTLANNLFFCALAGLLWYSQFFGLGIGESFFEKGSVMMAFSWSILMSLIVLFSNVWGILLKEWKGSDNGTIAVLIAGLLILIFSIIFPQFWKY